MKIKFIWLLSLLVVACTEKPTEQKLSNIFDPIADFDDIPPIIKVNISPDSGIVNETVFEFDARESRENDLEGANLFYLWDTNDNAIWDSAETTNPVLYKKFSSGGGNKKINLRVKGAKNLFTDTSFTIYVNTKPTIVLDWVQEANFFRFDASASSDAEDGKNLEFRWDFNSDGSWDIDWNLSSVAEYTFEDENWQLSLEARDLDKVVAAKNYDENLALNAIAVYRFSGDAIDDSGNENHGTVYGATLTEDRFDNPNSAYLFDGVNDYINIGNDQSIKPQFPISVSAWINVSNFDVTNFFFSNDFNDGFYYGLWTAVNTDRTIAVGFGNGSPAGPNSRRGFRTTEPVIQVNKWYHVVCIFNSYNSFEVYVNNSKLSVINTGNGNFTSITYDNNTGTIGRWDSTVPIGGNYFFNGKIDEVYMFNVALTSEQVNYFYNN